MTTDLHNVARRPSLRINPVISSSVAPESVLTPATPLSADLRRRSVQAPHLDHLKPGQFMTSIKEKATPASELSEAEAFPLSFPGDNLSIWKRHFCKPLDPDPSQLFVPENRVFSFATRGFIFCAMLISLVLSAIIAPAVALTLDRKARIAAAKQAFPNLGSVANAPVYIPVPNTPIDQAIQINFPDPFILQYQKKWYAFATNNAIGVLGSPATADTAYDGKNVQVATSDDFKTWTLAANSTNVLPNVGAWSVRTVGPPSPTGPKPAVWAPAVLRRPSDGKFVMYYSARANGQGPLHCLGAALSTTDSPLGPYNPMNISFACPLSQGGAIDADPFIDTDGSIWISYKVDGNAKGNGGQCGNSVKPLHNTPIMLQKVLSDGMTPDGDPVTILDRTGDDGPLVEAPSMIKSADGTYFLFYSSGCTRDPSYDVKYAWATSVTGPYTRATKRLLKTGSYNLTAPGSVTVAQSDAGQWVMAFHARVKTPVGGLREMFTTGLVINGTNITVTDV